MEYVSEIEALEVTESFNTIESEDDTFEERCEKSKFSSSFNL